MLVLSRKLGEKIYIADNICVTVVGIGPHQIRLAIDAPRDVPIYRQERLPPDHPEYQPPRPPRHATAELVSLSGG